MGLNLNLQNIILNMKNCLSIEHTQLIFLRSMTDLGG